MNTPLVTEHYEILMNILDINKNLLGENEYKYRTKKLDKAYNKSINDDFVSNDFYSISNEIRAINLFAKFDNVRISKDQKGEPGVDLYYKDYQIECVICTEGNEKSLHQLELSGYNQFGPIIDGNKLRKQIYIRILSSLNSKKIKYDKDIIKKVISTSKPFVIFLHPGPLLFDWTAGQLCIDANRFLIGLGHLRMPIDPNSGKQIGTLSYEYSPVIENNNNSPLITNFFGNEENACISAVIITTANLKELYTNKNTFIFTNPFAINKLKVADFHDFVYWKKYKNNEYIPRCNGKTLKLKYKIL